jgi:hypothetical protein
MLSSKAAQPLLQQIQIRSPVVECAGCHDDVWVRTSVSLTRGSSGVLSPNVIVLVDPSWRSVPVTSRPPETTAGSPRRTHLLILRQSFGCGENDRLCVRDSGDRPVLGGVHLHGLFEQNTSLQRRGFHSCAVVCDLVSGPLTRLPRLSPLLVMTSSSPPLSCLASAL